GSGVPTGRRKSRRASSPVTRITGVTPPATSVSRTRATRRRTAPSRSGCWRERPRQVVRDDVLADLRLGRLVYVDRRVYDEPRDGETDALALHGEPDRGHRGAVLPGARRRPLLRDRKRPGRAPPAGRCSDVRRAPGDRCPRGFHSAPAGLPPVLHADARPRQSAGVASHPVAGLSASP